MRYAICFDDSWIIGPNELAPKMAIKKTYSDEMEKNAIDFHITTYNPNPLFAPNGIPAIPKKDHVASK